VDAVTEARNTAQQQCSKASPDTTLSRGGRSVDVEAQNGRQSGQQKELISRNFAEPSDGLEPSTPSLPCTRPGTSGQLFPANRAFAQ